VLVLIKITKYLRVHVLTIALVVFCIIFNKADMLCVTYAVMILHELAHCLAAVCIGLKISHIDFYPFGVNLKLKNKLVYSLADEMILYFSGPFCNILFALIAMIVYSRYPNGSVKFFYISNTMLFCMNMIPSVPLDGGILLKKIIAYRLGYNSANKIMTVISAVFSAMIMGLGIYVMYITKFNFSVLLFSALMIGNIFTQSEKYNVDLTKTLMFNNKKKKSVRHIVVENECNYCDIVDKFIPKDYNMVYIVSDDGKVKDIITETQVIDKLTTEQVL
jgi:stage IV sporulation protein FB